ncbi:Amidohydrolase [compost metagenome]
MKSLNRILMLTLSPTLAISAAAQGESKVKNDHRRMKIIAIEEHFLNAEITAATRDEVEKIAPGHSRAFVGDFGSRQTMKPEQLTDIGAGRIASMDKNGIDVQILSYNSPATELLPSPLAVELARRANDQLAAATKAYPGRFLGFATLPMSDPQAAAEELRRCVTELGFKGAMINGTAHGRFLDEPEFEPLFATAAELGVPLYIHPTIVKKEVRDAYYDNADPAFAARFASAGIGWHYEVGVHVMRLIFAGVFDRHPNLQVIMGHWGELIPFYMERIQTFFPATASPMKHDFKYYMQNNIYITPSGMFNLPQLQNALETMGADRIMFSVDYPYYPNEGARTFLENAPISQQDKEKIAHKNAERLFGLK